MSRCGLFRLTVEETSITARKACRQVYKTPAAYIEPTVKRQKGTTAPAWLALPFRCLES